MADSVVPNEWNIQADLAIHRSVGSKLPLPEIQGIFRAMGPPAPRLPRIINRTSLVGLVAASLILALGLWTLSEPLLFVALVGFAVCLLGFFLGLSVGQPDDVVWEKGPRYQDANYRIVWAIWVTGAVPLLVISRWSGDWKPLLTWAGLPLGMLPWLAIVGLVALASRGYDWLSCRRAKTDGPQG